MNLTFYNNEEASEINHEEFLQWLTFVESKFGYDFREYAPASLKRRLARIFKLFDVTDIAELQKLLAEDTAFFGEILPEITVGVTELFRDPNVWRYIRSEILPVLAKKERINIWHAGCSTGEEVYTMAILLSEAGLRHKTFQLGTDLNPNALAIAKNGLYSFRKLDIYQKNYNEAECQHKLQDYYTLIGANVQMHKSLLENVTFQQHDLVTGNVLGQFDLILCRNVLIYFDNNLQNKVLKLFSKSLTTEGMLIVGLYESLIWCSEVGTNLVNVSSDYNILRKHHQS